MKVSNEDKVLIGAGVAGFGILGFLYWRKKKKEKEANLLLSNNSKETETEPKLVLNPKPAQGTTLNKNKLKVNKIQ